MRFSDFQTDTGTLNMMQRSPTGDVGVEKSLSVEVDPVFGIEQTYDNEDEQVTGRSTIITTTPEGDLQSFYDDTHTHWTLDYNEKRWQVEQLTPIYEVGSNTLEHIELMLR